jgi:hypothetical protein
MNDCHTFGVWFGPLKENYFKCALAILLCWEASMIRLLRGFMPYITILNISSYSGKD